MAELVEATGSLSLGSTTDASSAPASNPTGSNPTVVSVSSTEKDGKEISAENDDDDGDDDDDAGVAGGGAGTGDKKKKKKKKPKKKGAAAVKDSPSAVAETTGTQLPKSRRLTGFTDYYVAYGQTNPPTKTVASLFPNGGFPVGLLEPHGVTKHPYPER
jgi:hypothetical protein